MIRNVLGVLHDLSTQILGVEWNRLPVLAQNRGATICPHAEAVPSRRSWGSIGACQWPTILANFRRQHTVRLHGSLGPPLFPGKVLDGLLEQVKTVGEMVT